MIANVSPSKLNIFIGIIIFSMTSFASAEIIHCKATYPAPYPNGRTSKIILDIVLPDKHEQYKNKLSYIDRYNEIEIIAPASKGIVEITYLPDDSISETMVKKIKPKRHELYFTSHGRSGLNELYAFFIEKIYINTVEVQFLKNKTKLIVRIPWLNNDALIIGVCD